MIRVRKFERANDVKYFRRLTVKELRSQHFHAVKYRRRNSRATYCTWRVKRVLVLDYAYIYTHTMHGYRALPIIPRIIRFSPNCRACSVQIEFLLIKTDIGRLCVHPLSAPSVFSSLILGFLRPSFDITPFSWTRNFSPLLRPHLFFFLISNYFYLLPRDSVHRLFSQHLHTFSFRCYIHIFLSFAPRYFSLLFNFPEFSLPLPIKFACCQFSSLDPYFLNNHYCVLPRRSPGSDPSLSNIHAYVHGFHLFSSVTTLSTLNRTFLSPFDL